MRAYRETFRRHRVLFVLPAVVIALAVAVLTLTKPASYQSSASLWVDNGPSAGSSLGNTTEVEGSSTLKQTLLTELLATKSFDLAALLISALIILAITPNGQDRWDAEISDTIPAPLAPRSQPAFGLASPVGRPARAPASKAKPAAAGQQPVSPSAGPGARSALASSSPSPQLSRATTGERLLQESA